MSNFVSRGAFVIIASAIRDYGYVTSRAVGEMGTEQEVHCRSGFQSLEGE